MRCEKRNKNFQLYKSSINVNQLNITDRPTDFISNFAYPIVNKNRVKSNFLVSWRMAEKLNKKI
jgi:hypothetical protein